MRLPIRVKHLINTNFIGYGGGCAIEKALMDFFPEERISEAVDYVIVGTSIYDHKTYDKDLFLKDQTAAKKVNETSDAENIVIRTINIPTLKRPKIKRNATRN